MTVTAKPGPTEKGQPVERSPVAAIALKHMHPLESRHLAVEDWGQSPWRLQRIQSSSTLMFERESKDDFKRDLARTEFNAIGERLSLMKSKYAEIVGEAGEHDETARKLENDISFMEAMNSFMQSCINGLVSTQRSLAKSSEDIQKRYDELVQRGSLIERIVKQIPLLSGPIMGATALGGGAWQAVLSIVKHQCPPKWQPIAEGAANIIGLAAIYTTSYVTGLLSSRRKQKLLNECTEKQKLLLLEEKIARRMLIALIKNKALQLMVSHGYLLELKTESPGIYSMACNGETKALHEHFKEAVKRIFMSGGEYIPPELLVGGEAGSDSNILN